MNLSLLLPVSNFNYYFPMHQTLFSSYVRFVCFCMDIDSMRKHYIRTIIDLVIFEMTWQKLNMLLNKKKICLTYSEWVRSTLYKTAHAVFSRRYRYQAFTFRKCISERMKSSMSWKKLCQQFLRKIIFHTFWKLVIISRYLFSF